MAAGRARHFTVWENFDDTVLQTITAVYEKRILHLGEEGCVNDLSFRPRDAIVI